MRTRLVIVGLVLLVLSAVPAIGQSQADTANRSYELTHSTSAGGGNGGWVLAWVLGVAGGVALVAAFVVGGPKPQDSVPSASDSDPTTSTPDAAG